MQHAIIQTEAADFVKINTCVMPVDVEDDIEVIQPLPEHLLAQQLELLALKTACELGEGKALTVYSDSAYAIGVYLSWCGVWRARGFTKITGTPIKNRPYVEQLIEAMRKYNTLAIVKFEAYTDWCDNARIDEAAKLSVSRCQAHAFDFFSCLCHLKLLILRNSSRLIFSITRCGGREGVLSVLGLAYGYIFYLACPVYHQPMIFQICRLAHEVSHSSKGK